MIEDEIREIAKQEISKAIADKFSSLNLQSAHINTKEAREKYGLHGATMYRHIKNGNLTLYKMGGKTYLKRAEVENLFVPVNLEKTVIGSMRSKSLIINSQSILKQ